MSRASKFKRLAAANPVARAMATARLREEEAARQKQVDELLARLRKELDSLRFLAELQAWGGESPAEVINLVARLVYVALGAAANTEYQDTADVRVIRGAGEALGDLAQDQDLERHRPAMQAALLAVERLLPNLDPIRMAHAAAELEEMLAGTQGLGTDDLKRVYQEGPRAIHPESNAVTN